MADALTFEVTGIGAKRLYATVAVCAVVVYLGALWNRFALDDVPIVVLNPLVAHRSGLWRAFAAPYWPPEFGGHMYRPLVIASFAIDRLVDGAVWYHAVNLLWHAGAAVAVAEVGRGAHGDQRIGERLLTAPLPRS